MSNALFRVFMTLRSSEQLKAVVSAGPLLGVYRQAVRVSQAQR